MRFFGAPTNHTDLIVEISFGLDDRLTVDQFDHGPKQKVHQNHKPCRQRRMQRVTCARGQADSRRAPERRRGVESSDVQPSSGFGWQPIGSSSLFCRICRADLPAHCSASFAALRASSVESRFEAMHASGLTALVGREEELELLLRRWARAKTGEGQVVLLSGEAGIGKSRLSAALMEGLAAEPHTRLRYFCSPQHTDSAFYPIIGQFQRAAGFMHDDAPQTKLDKLDSLLAQTSTSKQDAALLAEMLSLSNDGRYPALEPIPEQRRQKTLEALGVQLETLARVSSVPTASPCSSRR